MSAKPTYEELLQHNIDLKKRNKELKKHSASTRNKQREEILGQ